MPNYKGHLFAGSLAYVACIVLFALYTLSTYALFLFLACCLAGSIFPDIDTKSKAQQLFYAIAAGIFVYCAMKALYKPLLFLCGVSFLPLMVRHRGLFHKLWFVLFVIIAAAVTLGNIFPKSQFLILWGSGFFALGVITHLWLDLGWRNMLRW